MHYVFLLRNILLTLIFNIDPYCFVKSFIEKYTGESINLIVSVTHTFHDSYSKTATFIPQVFFPLTIRIDQGLSGDILVLSTGRLSI